jgi:hypothetical protein
MSYWNYRIIFKPDPVNPDREGSYEIHEVYYDDNDKIDGWTVDAIASFGETIEDLNDDLKYMLEALDRPVLMEQTSVNCKCGGRVKEWGMSDYPSYSCSKCGTDRKPVIELVPFVKGSPPDPVQHQEESHTSGPTKSGE